MKPENSIWIFIGEGGRFPGAAFNELADAEAWVLSHKLTGMISAMPIDQGLFDWALENDALNMKPEKLSEKLQDPEFIGTCTTGSLEHYHYEDGLRD
jgi:hypothetical protein